MPDPNNPDVQIPPDPALDPAVEAEPLTPEQEEAEKSSIQNAMEGALDRSLAAAKDTGIDVLKTYPISEKMRERLKSEFIYHAPRQDQIPRYAALRTMALTFATMVVELTPPSREQSLALTKLGEAIMHSNAAIARGEVDEASSEKEEEEGEIPSEKLE